MIPRKEAGGESPLLFLCPVGREKNAGPFGPAALSSLRLEDEVNEFIFDNDGLDDFLALVVAAVAAYSVWSLQLAALWADRIVLLHNGRLVSQGTPEAVLQADDLKRWYGAQVHVGQHPANGSPQVFLAP